MDEGGRGARENPEFAQGAQRRTARSDAPRPHPRQEARYSRCIWMSARSEGRGSVPRGNCQRQPIDVDRRCTPSPTRRSTKLPSFPLVTVFQRETKSRVAAKRVVMKGILHSKLY